MMICKVQPTTSKGENMFVEFSACGVARRGGNLMKRKRVRK